MAGGGKSKAKEKVVEDPKTWKGPWCVLHQGEKGVPVLQYITSLASDIMCTTHAPGETVSKAATGMLIDTAKAVLFKIISMAFREIDARRCFSTMAHTNIFVTPDGLVKTRNGNVLIPATDTQIVENVHALGNLIDQLVAAASASYSVNRSVNPELKNLLYLMKKYRNHKASRFLMQFHPCNVPDANRGFYYLVVHDETVDVLRYSDTEVFQYVVDGVNIPQNMFTRMKQNTILKRYLARGKYDPAKMKGIPKLLPITCLRNIPSHGREDAGDAIGPYFSREDLARMVYDKAPMALASMAKGLDAAGVLKTLRLQKLFPGLLEFHMPS